jgi:hypothetical protein
MTKQGALNVPEKALVRARGLRKDYGRNEG